MSYTYVYMYIPLYDHRLHYIHILFSVYYNSTNAPSNGYIITKE